MDLPQLSREQLASLIPMCPLIMDWLRNRTVHTADLLLQSFPEDYDSVAVALDALAKRLEETPNIPFNTLSQILSKFSHSVWANALRLILTQSQPRIVSEEVGSDLVSSIPRLNASCTVTEVCHILGPLLDKLPRTHFVTLGEFCSLLRDTGSNATLLACLVGPQLLLPNLQINAPKNQGPGALASAAVMELLIAESESLFGRSASTRVFLPFGEFGEFAGMQNQRQNAAIDFEEAAEDPNFRVAKAALRSFYDWRDPMKSNNTERLFQRLQILSIAQGLQAKYGLIPPGWGIIVKAVLDKEQSRSQKRPQKDPDSLYPTGMDDDLLRLKQAAEKKVGNQTSLQETEGLKMVIQEMCASENRYHETLNTFLNTYCQKLQDIINGRDQISDEKTLQLSALDVETIFGQRLVKVKDTSAEFVALLGVLTDFQGMSDSDGRGRLGMLVDAFNEIFPKLDSLGPYMATYTHVIKLINDKSMMLKKKKKKKRKKGLDFEQLWLLERVKYENLKLSSLENVLIKPVQRIPQYKILIKELLKKGGEENHPCVPELEDLLQRVEALGQRIDRSVSSANKQASKLLGI